MPQDPGGLAASTSPAGDAFEVLLATLGITQKNGELFKPTTQSNIERFWRTLKKHLAAQNAGEPPQYTLAPTKNYQRKNG